MTVILEHSHTVSGANVETTMLRGWEFLRHNGFDCVAQEETTLRFRRGHPYPRTNPRDYKTLLTLRFRQVEEGTRVDLISQVSIPRALVMRIDQLFWEMERLALQTALDGKTVPEWRAVYEKYRRYDNSWLIVFGNLLLVFPVLLLPVVFYRLTSSWGLTCIGSMTGSLILMLITPFLMQSFYWGKKTADQLWQEANRRR